MTPLITGMLSSMLMGGIRGLLGGGGAAGGSSIPTSFTGMPMGQAPQLSSFPAYADGDLIRDLPIPITPTASQAPPMMEDYGARQPSVTDYLDIAASAMGGPYKDDYVQGKMASGFGRAGIKLPVGEGQLSGGVRGGLNYIDLNTPIGRFEELAPQFYGADIGYSNGGREYGFTYGQNPNMQGGVDRSYMLNYSMPFADGGIAGLPPIPPGETPQMAYAMDKGGMIRGPGGGVDDLIGGSIDNRNKVLLSDGEFVVPARVVSALGDGSSEAGAKVLHDMIDRVKDQAEDRLKDNGNINLSKVLPA